MNDVNRTNAQFGLILLTLGALHHLTGPSFHEKFDHLLTVLGFTLLFVASLKHMKKEDPKGSSSNFAAAIMVAVFFVAVKFLVEWVLS